MLKHRIDEAAKFVSLDQLALSAMRFFEDRPRRRFPARSRRAQARSSCASRETFGARRSNTDGGDDGGRFTVDRQHSARYAGTGVPPSWRSTWALSCLHARWRSRRPPILDRRNRLPLFNGHPEIETLRRPAPDANGVESWRPLGMHDQFQFRVKPGIAEVRFGDPGWRLGYTKDAVGSHFVFANCRRKASFRRA